MNILFKPITDIIKIKSHTAAALARLDLYLVRDLLLHKPHNYIAKSLHPDLSALKHGEQIVAEVTIKEIQAPSRRGSPTKIYTENDTGSLTLVFFNKIHPFLFSRLRFGAKIIVTGKAELNDFYYQISHPEIIFDRKIIGDGIEPVYPLTYGVTNKQIHGYILKALGSCDSKEQHCHSRAGGNPELTAPQAHNFLDPRLRGDDKLGGDDNMQTLLVALKGIHIPKSQVDAATHIKTIARLELLSNQLSLTNIRKNNCTIRGAAFPKAADLQNQILRKLQFELSPGQVEVIEEIESDQAAEIRMTRMLQGDVGSGKTLVALMTILNVATKGAQSALMAPTDLLAAQHFAFFLKALDGLCEVALLTGKTKPKERAEILERLASGQILILIGTHALFQTKVIFGNLGYIIIDEQHRFGVEQRLELLNKAQCPDLLVMTATPIPRSLSLTLFGDMAVSRLKSKPQNRPAIITSTTRLSKVDDVIMSLDRKLQKGERVYWVCPLIEQSDEKSDDAKDFADVLSRWSSLSAQYPGKVGLLHGKLPSEVKDDVMQQFKRGELEILVATTVIEVGIDVPEASLIVIENAERFGLAQLHQLRGRVGRGMVESHCILLYGNAGAVSRQRLEIMRTSNDGFYIAEEDLKLRGGGEILGTKQSGQQEFRFADLATDVDLLVECNKLASKMVVDEDTEILMRVFNHTYLGRA
jgi:ATP-dependent DNA helicase RecG